MRAEGVISVATVPVILLRIFLKKRLILLWQLGLFVLVNPVLAQDTQRYPAPVQLEELTSTGVRDRLATGVSTILIPIGGTEQSGPYVVLGKHNFRARYLADKIAQKLGNTLVARLMAYVPEGAITPPTSHMRFTGTISIPDAAFNGMLEGAVRSFKQHGFRTIVFLSDHGGYLKNVKRMAQKLNQSGLKISVCVLLRYLTITV